MSVVLTVTVRQEHSDRARLWMTQNVNASSGERENHSLLGLALQEAFGQGFVSLTGTRVRLTENRACSVLEDPNLQKVVSFHNRGDYYNCAQLLPVSFLVIYE